MILKTVQIAVISIVALCAGFLAAHYLTESREDTPSSLNGRLRIDDYESASERLAHAWGRALVLGVVSCALAGVLSSASKKPILAAIVCANPLIYAASLILYWSLRPILPAITIQVGEFINLRIYLASMVGAILGSAVWTMVRRGGAGGRAGGSLLTGF